MEFSVKSGSPEKQRSACIVVGVFEPRRLSPIAEQLDKISDGYISALLRRGELEGKVGQTLLLHHVPNILSERILLIGCGKERELDERQYKQVIQKTINTLNDTGSMEAVCFLTELHVKPQYLLESASGGGNRQRDALHLRSAEKQQGGAASTAAQNGVQRADPP